MIRQLVRAHHHGMAGPVLLGLQSELDITMQAKLLRALQEREIRRVGGTKSIKIEFRYFSR